jgi:hypothetical protein
VTSQREPTANSGRSPVTSLVHRLLPRLKYPHLFLVLAALFLIDLVVPDPIPFVDEALLALLTFLVGTWRTRRDPPPTQDTALPDGETRESKAD